jgi:hypothetical protein
MDGESVNNEFGSFRHDRLPSSFEQRQGWSYNANLSDTANSLVLIGDDPSAQISSWSGCRSESNISHANLVVRI